MPRFGHRIQSAALLCADRTIFEKPSHDIASSRPFGDIERRLPRPGGGPVEIGTMREEILRGGELAAMAGVPERPGEIGAAQRRGCLEARLDRRHHSERSFVPELGTCTTRDQSARTLPLSVANSARQRRT